MATVGVLFGVQLLTALVPLGLGALAPIVRDRFDLTRGEVGLAATAVFTSVALLSIPMGRMTDRLGVARALAIASALVGGAAAGMAVAGRYGLMLVFLAVAGVGYAAVTPATNKGVIVAVPARGRGRAMGVKQMGVTGAGMVAAAVLPGSIERLGWRPTLLFTGAAIAVLGSAGAAAYRALTHGRSPGDGRTSAPAGRATVRRLLALGAVVALMIAAQAAVATNLSLFLVDERGLRVTAAAAALALLHASGAVARLGWGHVSDRLAGGRLRTVALIGACSAAGLAVIAAAGASVPPAGMVALVVVLGISTQGGNAVYQTALAEEDEERAGRASGIGMSLGFTGAIVAPPAFGAAVDATGSYSLPFALTAAVVGVASLAALRLATRRPSPRPEPGSAPYPAVAAGDATSL